MTVAKVIEVNASSTVSMEDAVKHGLKKTPKPSRASRASG